jgi:hypothetical protein
LAQRGTLAGIHAFFKEYTVEPAWRTKSDRLQRQSRVIHDRQVRRRKQRTYIGKYSFVSRTIQLWNQLPADALETLSSKRSNFRKRVRKVINEVK